MEELDDTVFHERILHLIIPYPNSQGVILHPRTLKGDPQVTYCIYKCRVRSDNIHIPDFFPCPTLVCFGVFGSTPAQGIPHINRRVLHIGVRTKFVFKAWILEQ